MSLDMNEMILSEINIYPIKATAQYRLKSAMVEGRGLAYDRRWMLVDEQGRFLTQRQYPVLALIKTRFAGDSLLVSAAPQKDLLVPLEPAKQCERIQVTVWRDTVSAVHLGAEYDAWFSHFLQMPCRLVFMDSDAARLIDQAYALDATQTVSFADGYPLLLLSEASVAALNQKLQKSVSTVHFRPNLVVSGCEAFAEDQWKRIRIGNVEFALVKPCSRCVVTTIDPKTGLKDPDQEPLRTLSSFRKQDSQVFFGQNLIALNQGKIYQGDPLEVIE